MGIPSKIRLVAICFQRGWVWAVVLEQKTGMVLDKQVRISIFVASSSWKLVLRWPEKMIRIYSGTMPSPITNSFKFIGIE